MTDIPPEIQETPAPDEVRCPCGALLLRSLPQGIEVKCRRCKRAIVMTWEELGTGGADTGRLLHAGCLDAGTPGPAVGLSDGRTEPGAA